MQSFISTVYGLRFFGNNPVIDPALQQLGRKWSYVSPLADDINHGVSIDIVQDSPQGIPSPAYFVKSGDN